LRPADIEVQDVVTFVGYRFVIVGISVMHHSIYRDDGAVIDRCVAVDYAVAVGEIRKRIGIYM
jgi:hypothetical protein